MYRDKDYAGEASYIHKLISESHQAAHTVLNLGCGTGNHDFFLAEKGYEVTAVDLSEEMIANAKAKSKGTNPEFFTGDIRNFRSGKKFDAVISLFHVMSYQTTNQDLMSSFATAKEQMKDDGVFIFDCWYGPGVLHDKPAIRMKDLQDEHIQVKRTSVPVIDLNKNLVEVNFNVVVKNKSSGEVNEIRETHNMRYLFYPEIELMAKLNQLKIVTFQEWMTGNTPTAGSWYTVFVLKHDR
jgi:SAM-dependent methyltransferase